MEVVNTLGRRKKSIARIYMSKGNGTITVNGRAFDAYFTTDILRNKIKMPFEVTETLEQYDIKANIYGGGIAGQAGALQLAIARALVKESEDFRAVMKPHALLTRDPRMVERKKFGQKKARKKFQFSKR
ncbi:MAG: 30S ribosomal protein S9 [Salibacteraceae bacterium]